MIGKDLTIFAFMNLGYGMLGAFFLGGLLFVGAGFSISLLLQKRKPGEQKSMPYECGEVGVPMSSSSFPFRYYLPALIFLLFEIEIVLLAPVLLAQKSFGEFWTEPEWRQLLKTEALFFGLILAGGYFLALGGRYFDWEKPPSPTLPEIGFVPDRAYEQFNLAQKTPSDRQSPDRNSGA